MSSVKISDISFFVTSGSRGWASYYADSGALFLRMTNLPKNGIKLLLDDNKYVQLPEKSNEGKRTAVQDGDILISITAELGKIGFVEQMPDSEAYINQHICLVRPIQDKVNSKFLAYYLSSQPQRNLLNRLNDSGAKSGLNLSTIAKFPIILPDRKTQEFIVDTLEQWDTAIEKIEALIDAKERQFGWFRQNVLTGKVRMQGYNQPWKQQVLGSILTENKLTSSGTEEVHSVSVHKGVINQIEHLGRSFAAQNTDHYNLVNSGDIIYTKSPTGDFPYGIIKQNKLNKNVIVSPLYGIFTPRSRELGVILDAYFESYIYAGNYLRPIIQKGAKNTISCTNKYFLSKGLFLPNDSNEEKALALYISTSKQEITLFKKLADQYRTQKRGLMQKLLTGKWRMELCARR